MDSTLQSDNYWIIIPPQVAGLEDLPNGAKLVFGRIFALSQKSGMCWARNKHLAMGTGLKQITVSEYVSLLAQRGLIRVSLERNDKQEVIDRKIWLNLFTPPIRTGPDTPIRTEPYTLSGQNLKKEKNNNIEKKEKELHERKENSDSLVEFELTSKNSLTPLTYLERWEMAKQLHVPMAVIKDREDAFWDYVEDPHKRRKYKTAYLTIRQWVRRDLSEGRIQENEETAEMILDNQHPDIQEQIKWASEQAKKRGDV